jgi:SKICH domain
MKTCFVVTCYSKELCYQGITCFVATVADIKLEDGEFYQFCYVVASSQVRGVSTPFQFIADDFEVVSDNTDSSNFVHKEMDSFVQAVVSIVLNLFTVALHCCCCGYIMLSYIIILLQ